MRKITLLSIFAFWANLLLAQNITYTFLGQGSQQDVRLFWYVDKWPEELMGFDIKRRTGKNDWEKLNNTTITPTLAQGADLSNRSNNDAVIQDLNKVKQEKNQNNQIRPIPDDQFKQELKNAEMLQAFSVVLNIDFFNSLIVGFGFLDHNSFKEKQEYGLFPVFKDGAVNDPVKTFVWDPNDPLIIDVPATYNMKALKNKVKLYWHIEEKDFTKHTILNGFDVYKVEEGKDHEKINKSRIWVDFKEGKGTVFQMDVLEDKDKPVTYALVPATIFNLEGEWVEMKYDPADRPQAYNAPVLKKLSYSDKDNKQQVVFEWEFEQANEAFIKGFNIKKQNAEGLFETFKGDIARQKREFVFEFNESLLEPLDFLVEIEYSTGEVFQSNIKGLYIPKSRKPEKPMNLTYELERDGEDMMLKLFWGHKGQGPINFIIYTAKDSLSTVIKDDNYGEISQNSVLIPIYSSKASVFKVAVSALNESYQESDLSDPLVVLLPSTRLPNIDIWPIQVKNDKVSLAWKYPNDILDLAGFRLYQNDILVADEKALKPGARSWESKSMTAGSYEYFIEAVSKNGVVSKRSEGRRVKIN
jgi:hypothetical protein